MAALGTGLARVGSVIAVSSGKGGVGKSNVAVNLAFALAQAGARVGLFDADIYGPSLPTMVHPADTRVFKRDNGCVNALEHEGVKLMSYGWVAPRNAAGERSGAIMRGPMVSSVLQQLLKFTEWGQLDHLVVDMPPGTGDIHITLGQTVPITSAVIVTTPHKLALTDVVKGLQMFKAMRVVPGALVVNMCYFDADGHRYYPFGRPNGSAHELAERHSIPRVFELPILPEVAEAGDVGTPFVTSHPESPFTAVFVDMARQIAEDVERRVAATSSTTSQAAAPSGEAAAQARVADDAVTTTLRFDAGSNAMVIRVFGPEGAREYRVAPRALRLACSCAACVDEHTGEVRIQPEKIRDDVRPTSIQPQGNYAFAVEWSDRHTSSIYSHAQLQKLAQGAAA